MAEYLNPAKSKKSAFAVSRAILALAVLTASISAAAEDLPDPTRPPAGFGQFQADAVPSGPVLQSILISPSRRIAIISGKTVKAGDKFGDAQVLAINESEVVLKTGKNQQVLKLYPSLHNPMPISHSGSNLEIPGQSR
jgi:MSHA biogenesis protein MshK